MQHLDSVRKDLLIEYLLASQSLSAFILITNDVTIRLSHWIAPSQRSGVFILSYKRLQGDLMIDK